MPTVSPGCIDGADSRTGVASTEPSSSLPLSSFVPSDVGAAGMTFVSSTEVSSGAEEIEFLTLAEGLSKDLNGNV